MRGVSICVLTYNVSFYNRLALDLIRLMTRVVDYEVLVYDNGSTDGSAEWLDEQPDVTLHRGSDNSMRHGAALDFLVQQARFPICCTLCSDAFPVSPEWLTPAMHLDGVTMLSGVLRDGSRIGKYVCPSYLFGWTDWLRRRSFLDNWPDWDTGEALGRDCVAGGWGMKTWKQRYVDVGEGFRPKPCDYNGWVWHVWWSGRRQVVPGIEGSEFEEGYHEHSKRMLRERFNLDY